jgi:pimeloyl-ACP methyl ester carboxylesterase
LKSLEQYQKQIQIRSKNWNVFETGSDTPIVFLHNGGGTLWNWVYQLQFFSSKQRIIAPDLPGFGRSHRPFAPLTLNNYVEDISKLLDVLGCSKPILVGNCIGSSIALEYTLRQPEKVAALALFNICGGIPMLSPHLQYWASLRPNTTFGRSLQQHAANLASHPSLRRLNESTIYADGEPDLHPILKQFIQHQHHDSNLRASLYWLMMGLDTFNVFSQPRQRPANFPPVFLGWGSQNRTLPVRWAKVIAEWLTPDRFEIIERTGHMPMYEKPELVNEALESFFKEHKVV